MFVGGFVLFVGVLGLVYLVGWVGLLISWLVGLGCWFWVFDLGVWGWLF